MKTLREIDPIAANEWYYPLNGDMTPDNIAGKSAKRAYFQCPKNPKHIFNRRIYLTTDEKGNHKACPFCKGKEVFSGENDFLTFCPEAKELWDYEKNTVDPTKLSPNSKKYAYFKCMHGHSFRIQVYMFKRYPFCRICNKYQNSLLAANPSVVDIWDYKKNGHDRPEYHWKTDPDLVWWKCKKCGYGWQAKISTKYANKSLCPVCEVGKRFKKNVNDLFTKFPDIILDWNYLKNKDLGPDDVTLWSPKKVWWKCHICGYEWKSAINVHILVKNDIISFRKCPVCIGRVALAGKNDLATTHPSLAKEYVPELNTIPLVKIRPGSGLNITWRCNKCHQLFTTSPDSRTRKSSGGGCPYCSSRYPIPNATDFATQYPHIASEWDYNKNPGRPEDYMSGSKYNASWQCRENPMHKWKALINDRKPGFKRCPYCNNSKTILDLTKAKPKLIKYWDYEKNTLGPEKYTEFSNQMVYWKCKKGHSFQNKICNYLEHDFECHICMKIITPENYDEFEILYPDLIRELDISRNSIKPNQINCNSKELIWWICPDRQHSYQMNVFSRTMLGKSCPICRSENTHTEDSRLLSRYPEIERIWDYENNDGLIPENILCSTRATFNYKCHSGHKWNESLPTLIQNNFACAYCSGRRLLPGYNSVSDVYPHLVDEWNTKNLYNHDILLYTSKVTISWNCHVCGQSYYSGLDEKINGTSTCPYCNGEKGIPGKTSIKDLYPEICKEYDLDNPISLDEIGPLSILRVTWNCTKCDMTWHSIVSDRINGSATCPYCSGEKAIPGRTSFKALYSELMKEFSPANKYNPDELIPTFNVTMQWNCSTCDMQWDASIRDRVNGEAECPYCSGKKAIPGRTSFKALHPELMKEFSPANIHDPDELLPTHTLFYMKWYCSACNMEWEASIRDRVNGDVECTYCSRKKAIPGKTSFKALYPDLIEEFSSINDYNPDDLLPTYTLPMKWNCSQCSMEWEASIRDRVNDEAECPYCSGKKAIPGKTSLKALYPELMSEWKYISNLLIANPDHVLPSSTKEVWWECLRCNKSYSIKIKDKVNLQKKNKEPCPFCKGYRRIKRRYFKN